MSSLIENLSISEKPCIGCEEMQNDPMVKFIELHLEKFVFHLRNLISKYKIQDEGYACYIFSSYFDKIIAEFEDTSADLNIPYYCPEDEELEPDDNSNSGTDDEFDEIHNPNGK